MARLDSLIKLHQHRVDELQQKLADLYAEIQKLERHKADILNELEHEKDIAAHAHSAEEIMTFPGYAQLIRQKTKLVDETIEKIEYKVSQVQETLKDAYSELKRAELIQEKRDAAELAELEKKEREMLDEIGLETWRRNGEQ